MHRKFQTQGEWPKEKIRKLQHTYKENMYLDKEEGQRVGSLSKQLSENCTTPVPHHNRTIIYSKVWKGGEFIAVLGIRIRNRIRGIRMFLGLLDPDPDPLDRGTDPDPAPDPSLYS
jgi:hypothetical protein